MEHPAHLLPALFDTLLPKDIDRSSFGISAIGVLFYGLIHVFRRRLLLVVAYLAIFGKVFTDAWAFCPRYLQESSFTASSMGFLDGMHLKQQDLVRLHSLTNVL